MRRSIAALLAGAVALAGLLGGGPVASADGPKVDTILHCALDLAKARAAGLLEPTVTDASVLDDTIKVVTGRLARWGATGSKVSAAGEGAFDVRLAAGTVVDEAASIVTAIGELQFRIEVRADYGAWEQGARPREVVWDPKLGDFAAYERGEIESWKRSQEGGSAFVPSDPRFRLVPRRGTSAKAPGDLAVPGDSAVPGGFAIVEEPQGNAARFDERLVNLPRAATSYSGEPTVTFEVKGDFQRGFSEWTNANLGLPIAILLDGELLTAPVLQDRLTTNVQITMSHEGTLADAAREAKRLAALLAMGTLPVKPRVVSKETAAPEAPPAKPPAMGK